MANRFNQWAPTRYVGLPIDYYQQSLGVREQRTQEAVDKAEALANAYGSIEPFGPNATALYDQTIAELRAGVEEIGKEKLSTPEAQRKVDRMMKDPRIVENLNKVYQDSLYAADTRKKLNEYLVKNPEINAVDYLKAFHDVGYETGDPAQFNPNRFKNMPALPEYFDINKLIADEATKLKSNEEELKKIVGPLYKTYKDEGVLEERIRELARGRMLTDPQARAQFERNVRYGNYQADPRDIQSGMRKNAAATREAIGSQQQQIQSRIAQMSAGKTDDQLRKSDPNTYHDIQRLRAMDKSLGKYNQLNPDQSFAIDDQELVNETSLDRLVSSFDPYAWRHRSRGEEWTPMAIAEFKARAAERLFRIKKAALEPENMMHLTIPNTEQQVPITEKDWHTYVKKNVPGLNLTLGSSGELNTPGLSDEYQVIHYDKTGKRGKQFYRKEDVKPWGLIPENERQNYDIEGDPHTRDQFKYGIRKGAVPVKEVPKSEATYKDNLTNLKAWIDKKGLGTNYDWTNEADQRRALQDVIRFNQANERAYMTGHTFPAGTTQTFKDRVSEMFGRVPVYDNNGKTITGDDLKKLNEEFKKQKPTINGQATDFEHRMPVYSFQLNGNTYRMPMHNELQQILGVPNAMMNQMLDSETGVFEYGPHKDLFINKMGPNGQPINMVVASGATPQYQSQAKAFFNDNLAKLEAAGYTRKQAEDYLDQNFTQMQEYFYANQGIPFPVNNTATGKTASLQYVVGRHRDGSRPNSFKYFSNNVGPTTDLDEYIYNSMQQFGSYNTPETRMLNWGLRTSKNRDADYMGMGLEEDEFSALE